MARPPGESSTPGGPCRRPRRRDVLTRHGGPTRTKAVTLHRALQALGRPYECERCGNRGEWCGAGLLLDIDHIDGDRYNDTAENLRYLCPNCHRQEPTTRGSPR